MSNPELAAAPQPTPQAGRSFGPVEWLLAAIVASLLILTAAVVHLTTVLDTNTRPTPAPTVADRKVSLAVRADNAFGTVTLATPEGRSSTKLESSLNNEVSWQGVLRQGKVVEAIIQLTSMVETDGTAGKITCRIVDEAGAELSSAEASVDGGIASCRWSNEP